MYQVFFHIASITILEICFFFYYVGPLETDIFMSYVKRIMDGPLGELDASLERMNISRSQIIQGIYLVDANDQQQLHDQLEKDKNEGIKERDEDNEELFLETIKFWSIICAFALAAFLAQFCYKKYYKKREKNNMVTIFSDPSMNSMESELEMTVYRKESIDETDSSTDDADVSRVGLMQYENPQSNNKRVYLKTVSQYVVYGVGIIGFQYLFFNYVVFSYKPLSIEEIRYYLYNRFLENQS